MSIARHLDSLAVYRAQAIRLVPDEGDPEDLIGEGGGLGDAFEQHGQRALVDVLRDPHVRQVLLADGDLTIEAERQGARGRLRVRWGDKLVVDDVIEIPSAAAVLSGPTFRPDPRFEVKDVVAALHDPAQALHAVGEEGGPVRWYTRGLHGRGAGEVALRATIPAVDPASLGSDAFKKAHGVKWAYAVGDMAGGISSADLVLAAAKAGLIGFFGAGGLPVAEVEKNLERIVREIGGRPFGINLLHNPAEPEVEERTVDLYLKHGVRRVSASAYMDLTPAVVRYRLTGIRKLPDGRIEVPNAVLAKLSRPEVAERFLRPAPHSMVRDLVKAGVLTEEQADLAAKVPLAEDVTAEADSGGHTDRRPLVVLLPVIQRLRDRIVAEEGYADRGVRPRVGAAGGLGTPAALWAAFAMGADYVLTGSVNQAAVEAGTSRMAKEMLAEATFADVTTGPAPDMFELGAEVQVLGRGTMYAQRAARLYEIYKAYPSMADIPKADRDKLEKQIFRRDLDEVWRDTRAYWAQRDAKQVEKADKDGRHQMALTFRWYLGMTSRWARTGEESRKRDFQMWCGPAMGGFNEWVAGTKLAALENRTVSAIADALMYGAAAHARVATARALGLSLPAKADNVVPR